VDRLYTHLLARQPADAERETAIAMVGGPSPEGVEDLL
jgi:hypothetical protein